MPLTLTAKAESWPLEKPFAISRGVKTAADVVVCEISDGTYTGRAECVPYPRYGETVEGVLAQINRAALSFAPPALAGGDSASSSPREDEAQRGARMGEAHHAASAPSTASRSRSPVSTGEDQWRETLAPFLPPGAARNVIDCALWDLKAKRADAPVWQLAGLAEPKPAVTAYTISLGTPEAMHTAAHEARARPLLKVKLGPDDPVACLAAVRSGAPAARLIADANEGWSFNQLRAIADDIARIGVELIEQPLPAADDGALNGWQSPVTLCADESFHTSDQIPALAARYGAVNIKLDKAGGFTEALACLAAARAADIKVMIGCMVGTSLAMAPAAVLASACDVVDLDGPLLLRNDRPGGLVFEGSLMHPPARDLWG